MTFARYEITHVGWASLSIHVSPGWKNLSTCMYLLLQSSSCGRVLSLLDSQLSGFRIASLLRRLHPRWFALSLQGSLDASRKGTCGTIMFMSLVHGRHSDRNLDLATFPSLQSLMDSTILTSPSTRLRSVVWSHPRSSVQSKVPKRTGHPASKPYL